MVWAKKILHLGPNRGGHDPGTFEKAFEKESKDVQKDVREKFLGRGSEGLRLKSD